MGGVLAVFFYTFLKATDILSVGKRINNLPILHTLDFMNSLIKQHEFPQKIITSQLCSKNAMLMFLLHYEKIMSE